MTAKQVALSQLFKTVRTATVNICNGLANEDFGIQPAPEVSPPKWHLGHTSWLFEEAILAPFKTDYKPFNPHYQTLFNSYYKAVGPHTLQSKRGDLSRPTVDEVMQYRAHIDAAMHALLTSSALSDNTCALIETAIHHEQQHQELLYMDIKYILASNAIPTTYQASAPTSAPTIQTSWAHFEEGLVDIGDTGHAFAYDNERPTHKHYLYPFAINQALVTNGDFLAFIENQGYQQAQYWLSQGWDWVTKHHIQQPLYWRLIDDQWYEYTLYGLLPLDLNQPLVHISYFEADAFAKWKGLRLPTEQELEVFLNRTQLEAGSDSYHPNHAQAAEQVWCWTASQYMPYPRYKAFDGLLKEYNGKFMCNQFVLRGGCIVTPQGHYRHSYRNFYLPEQRWMFSGIRLAKDIT